MGRSPEEEACPANISCPISRTSQRSFRAEPRGLEARPTAESALLCCAVNRRGELVLPASDDHAGEAVAEDIDGRAAHVHELINPKEKKKRLRRQMKGSGCSQDDHQGCTRYAGRAFAANQKSKQHNRLLADGEMNVRSLRNKQ